MFGSLSVQRGNAFILNLVIYFLFLFGNFDRIGFGSVAIMKTIIAQLLCANREQGLKTCDKLVLTKNLKNQPYITWTIIQYGRRDFSGMKP